MKINTQDTAPVRRDSSPLLEVHHMFPTIQGEGPFAGYPAIFLRLYGCNLKCPFCDTDYTSQCNPMLPATILEKARNMLYSKVQPYRLDYLLVITGGEPFRQNLTPICDLFIAHGWKVQIETNGTLSPGVTFPWEHVTVVCSPKTGRIHNDILAHAAFKYVLEAGQIDPLDGLPLNTLGQHEQVAVAKPHSSAITRIYVQALDEQDAVKNAANLAAASESAMRYGYRLSVQTHKIANLE